MSMTSMRSTNSDTEAMRDHGRSLNDQGFIEINFVSGDICWINEFVSKTCEFEQLQNLTLYDVIPDRFHDSIRNAISDQVNGKFHKSSIWPLRNSNNQLVWWYSERVSVQHPLYWFKMEHMNTTPDSGPTFTSMCAVMETANNYNDLYNRIADFRGWTEENISRLGSDIIEIREAIDDVRSQMRSCLSAANRAANIALENAQTINTFKDDLSSQLSNHTAEILMLITTDTIYDKRVQIFENHTKNATSEAISAIQKQSEEFWKGLTRKVTIPVAMIVIIAIVIEWAIKQWG